MPTDEPVSFKKIVKTQSIVENELIDKCRHSQRNQLYVSNDKKMIISNVKLIKMNLLGSTICYFCRLFGCGGKGGNLSIDNKNLYQMSKK